VNKTVKTIKLDKNDLVTSTKPNPKISNANNMTLPIPKLCETTSSTVTRKVPVSNAAVERFFSCLGRVKTSQRSSLRQATLQNTLLILVSGKPLDSYDPHTAICTWEEAKNRRPNQRQRKKYKERRKKRHFGMKDVSTSETSDDSDNELQYGENSAEERISALGGVELFSSTSDSEDDL
jgi:hypothetical protein